MITNNVEEALLLSDRIVPMTAGPRGHARRRRSPCDCRGRAAPRSSLHDEQRDARRARTSSSTLTDVGPATRGARSRAAAERRRRRRRRRAGRSRPTEEAR